MEPPSTVPLQIVPTVPCSIALLKLELGDLSLCIRCGPVAQVLIQGKVIVAIVGDLPEPEAITFQICNYTSFRRRRRWVFLSVPSTVSPGCMGAGSQFQAGFFFFFATLLLDPKMQASEPGDQGVCPLAAAIKPGQPYMCTNSFHRDTSDLRWDRGKAR